MIRSGRPDSKTRYDGTTSNTCRKALIQVDMYIYIRKCSEEGELLIKERHNV